MMFSPLRKISLVALTTFLAMPAAIGLSQSDIQPASWDAPSPSFLTLINDLVSDAQRDNDHSEACGRSEAESGSMQPCERDSCPTGCCPHESASTEAGLHGSCPQDSCQKANCPHSVCPAAHPVGLATADHAPDHCPGCHSQAVQAHSAECLAEVAIQQGDQLVNHLPSLTPPVWQTQKSIAPDSFSEQLADLLLITLKSSQDDATKKQAILTTLRLAQQHAAAAGQPMPQPVWAQPAAPNRSAPIPAATSGTLNHKPQPPIVVQHNMESLFKEVQPLHGRVTNLNTLLQAVDRLDIERQRRAAESQPKKNVAPNTREKTASSSADELSRRDPSQQTLTQAIEQLDTQQQLRESDELAKKWMRLRFFDQTKHQPTQSRPDQRRLSQPAQLRSTPSASSSPQPPKAGLTVKLPVLATTTESTVVSVPDGGKVVFGGQLVRQAKPVKASFTQSPGQPADQQLLQQLDSLESQLRSLRNAIEHRNRIDPQPSQSTDRARVLPKVSDSLRPSHTDRQRSTLEPSFRPDTPKLEPLR